MKNNSALLRKIAMDEYDELAIYFGEPYKVNDQIFIRQPKIGEVIKYRQNEDIDTGFKGERGYFNMVSRLTCIPSDMKSRLWDSGIDYSKTSDFKLFTMMVKGLTPNETGILFNDLNLDDFVIAERNDTKELLLVNPITECIIDELVYYKIVGYLRKVHGFVPKEEPPANKFVRDILIQEERERLARHSDDTYKSSLLPLVSTLVNCADFKYKKSELMDVDLVEFMDSVKRIPGINTTKAIMNGMYSGMIDISKNPSIKANLNIYREL